MEINARADAPVTPRNSKRLPLAIRHTIGLLNDSLGADDYHNTNCSFAEYDGVTFEFTPSAVEIRAPTWSLTVFFGNPLGDGTSYSIHLFGGSARPGSPPD